MTNIVNQRATYLAEVHEKSARFAKFVIELYNEGKSAKDIAATLTNPKTGKPYSRQHIHKVIHRARSVS